MRYIPNTPEDRREMLDRIGADSVKDFLQPLPQNVLLEDALDIPPALTEQELLKEMKEMAAKNVNLDQYPSFLGGGAYDHFIPCIIDHIVSRSEFYTAYTPYQAEVSQGTLQSIFEYQTMICELTGMEVSNASLYDGGSGVAEAAIMANAQTRRKKALVAETVHPEYRAVLNTYAWASNFEVEEIPLTQGTKINPASVKEALDKDTSCFIVQYPNFFGSLEEMQEIMDILEDEKALLVVVANPLALGVLKPPSEFGADIVVGEGQCLGNPLSFGGPYLGYIAAKKRYLRRIPGRLSGQTVDQEGKRGFVMTLQAREQHIRREKASSNICTNEALNALMATIYMTTMGPQGIKEVASQSLKKAHYTAGLIDNLPGYEVTSQQPFFHEFMVETPKPVEEINQALFEEGIIGGLDLGVFDPQWKNRMLVCVTETRAKEEIDDFVQNLEVLK